MDNDWGTKISTSERVLGRHRKRKRRTKLLHNLRTRPRRLQNRAPRIWFDLNQAYHVSGAFDDKNRAEISISFSDFQAQRRRPLFISATSHISRSRSRRQNGFSGLRRVARALLVVLTDFLQRTVAVLLFQIQTSAHLPIKLRKNPSPTTPRCLVEDGPAIFIRIVQMRLDPRLAAHIAEHFGMGLIRCCPDGQVVSSNSGRYSGSCLANGQDRSL